MTTKKASNTRAGSTKWDHEHGILTGAPAPKGSASFAAKLRPVQSLKYRDHRKRLDMQVQMVTGGRWCIEARGFRWYLPDDVPFGEAMRWINRVPGYQCGECFA